MAVCILMGAVNVPGEYLLHGFEPGGQRRFEPGGQGSIREALKPPL